MRRRRGSVLSIGCRRGSGRGLTGSSSGVVGLPRRRLMSALDDAINRVPRTHTRDEDNVSVNVCRLRALRFA